MLPEINVIPTKDNIITEFKGLNQTEKCTEEEFSDMQNMYSEEYPFISPRKCRVLREYTNQPNNHYGDIVYGNDYYSIHKDYIEEVIDEQTVRTAVYRLYKNFEPIVINDDYIILKYTFIRRQIVKFGASLFIYPDNILYNPQDNTVQELDYSVERSNFSGLMYLSDKDGAPYILDNVTTFDNYARGGFSNVISQAYSNGVKAVDTAITSVITGSNYYGYTKVLGLKTIDYYGTDTGSNSIYKFNLCTGQKSKAKSDYTNKTNYPVFLITEDGNELNLSKYNETQSAWLPAEQYISYRITTAEYENYEMYANIKIGDYIKIRPLKSNGSEYSASDFINKESTYNLIKYLSDGIRIENIINDGRTIVFVFANKDFLKVIKEAPNKVVYTRDQDESKVIQAVWNSMELPGSNSDSLGAKVRIEKKVPQMDYITVSANRIWGCSSENHEIYACKQGDASCWFNYAGLASDSYAVTIASEEKFTGAITLNETPYFFKENMAYALYGNKPKNYQVQQIKCRGVEDGAYLSICQKDGYAYYKSTEGIERFNGNNSQSLTEMLNMEQLFGRNSAIGHDKYFVFVEDANEIYNLYVFDIKRGMWHIEDKNVVNVQSLVNIDGNVYLFRTTEGRTASDYVVERLTDIAKEKNNVLIEPLGKDVPSWYVESGEFNAGSLYNKYITKFMFEMKIEEDSNVKIYFSYNNTDKWERVFKSTDRHTKRTIKVPIVPKRCERMKYKIEGVGQAKIYTILMTIEGGSEEDGTETY